MLGNVALTLLTLLLLLLLTAAGWSLGARSMDTSQRAATHWSGCALMGALALALSLAREVAPAWISFGVSSELVVLGVLIMRRGLLDFLKQPLGGSDAEALALLGLMTCALALAGLLPQEQARPAGMLIVVTSLLWSLARTCIQVWSPLRTEFGDGMAMAVLSPILAGLSLFIVRLVTTVVAPQDSLPMPLDNPFNVAAAIVILMLTILMHGGLLALVQTRMVGRLRHLSQRDPLTGLLNRAEWHQQLDAQHRWLGRYGEPYAILMVDVDHFKSINDTLGHAAGDAALIRVAQVLSGAARDVDMLGRVGGEEFGVVLPRADVVSARRAAERLRMAIGEADIQWRQHPIRLTVSIGVALADNADESPQQAMDRADRALYQAKHGGRNKTVMSRVMVA